ncbi:MAG: hypothetical protein WD294_14345 [Phycisphaeraceae bacterium]
MSSSMGRLVMSGLVWVAMVVAAVGCEATPGADSRSPRAQPGAAAAGERVVYDLKLLTSPTALNLDDEPGPDGFAASIYAVGQDGYRSLPIKTGVLEVMLFDGVIRRRDVATAEPRQTWVFDPAQLASTASRSALGVGYGFTLRWDKGEPFEHGEVTILARYVPDVAEASPVYSAPVSLAIRPN